MRGETNVVSDWREVKYTSHLSDSSLLDILFCFLNKTTAEFWYFTRRSFLSLGDKMSVSNNIPNWINSVVVSII